jgi:hypothetical protein
MVSVKRRDRETTYTTSTNVKTVVLDVCRRVADQPFQLDLLPGARLGCDRDVISE